MRLELPWAYVKKNSSHFVADIKTIIHNFREAQMTMNRRKIINTEAYCLSMELHV